MRRCSTSQVGEKQERCGFEAVIYQIADDTGSHSQDWSHRSGIHHNGLFCCSGCNSCVRHVSTMTPAVSHATSKAAECTMPHVMSNRVSQAVFCAMDAGGQGTTLYMAPEIVNNEPYNEKCDVYSFGIVM